MTDKQQVRLNLTTNLANLVLSIIVGVVYTPYLVRHLGIAAYGVIPLALIINQYISVFTNSLTSSLTRFYSIALQNDDRKSASHYLSTSLIAILILIMIIIPIVIYIIININDIFNIPLEYLKSARILFILTFLSFISSLISSILNISLYAFNKLDKINYIKITRLILKYILVIAFFELVRTDIIYIGYANLIAELVVLLMSLLLFNKTNLLGVSIGIQNFRKIKLLSILGMTTWVLVHQLGDTALYRIDNIMVNVFWNTKQSGILAALAEFGGYVILMVSALSSLFGPLILIAYSKKDHSLVESLTLNNSLTVGIISSVLVGVLIGYANPVIYYWLGPQFTVYSHWFIIKLLTIPSIAASGIFAFTYRSWNKVRFPALATIVLGLSNSIIMCLLFYFFKNTKEIIFIGLLISSLLIIIQSYGLNSYWFGKIYKGNFPKVTKNFFIIQFVMALSIGISTVLNSYFGSKIVPMLLVGMAVSCIVSALLTYFIILNDHQKKMILALVK